MAETISWSLTAGGATGAGINTAGSTTGEATVSVSVDLDAQAERPLALQVDDVDKVAFLAISSDIIDGTITVKATGANATPLTGPILLFGEAVKLFASDLTTLTVKNDTADKTAKLSVLVGLTL